MSNLPEIKLQLENELKPAKLNNFLLDKIATVPPVYAVVFLHLNALARKGTVVDLDKIRLKFNITYSDIFSTLDTFSKMELLYFKNTNNSIVVSFSENFTAPVTEVAVEEKDESKRYSPLEIEDMTSHDPSLKAFYNKAQDIFSYSFSYTDYERLLYIHEEFLLSLEVILEVIKYCKLENKLNMNYLEVRCRNLYEEGIKDIEDVKSNFGVSENIYTEILKSLGIKGSLKPVQKDVIDKWFNEYNYSKDIILEACDKAVLSTNNPNINYVNGILNNWFLANVKTFSDIVEYEKSFSGKSKAKGKKSSLNNFKGTTTDYSDIESLERKFLENLGE